VLLTVKDGTWALVKWAAEHNASRRGVHCKNRPPMLQGIGGFFRSGLHRTRSL